MKWAYRPVETFCSKVVSGGTPSTTRHEYYGGDIPWLRTQEVDFNNIFDTELKITEAGLNNSAAKIIPENSVVVAMYGNSAGRVAINRIPLATNQACCNLIIDQTQADYRYVYHALKVSYGALKGQSRGAAQNNLNAAQVKAFEIPSPPLPTQQKIGDVISAYDTLIDNNRRRMVLLEESARLLYQEWFVRLRFPGHENKRLTNGLPESWSRVHLGDIVTTQYGYTETATKENIGPKFLRGTDINKTPFIDWSKVPHCPIDDTLKQKYQLHLGDILIIRMADPGKAAIVEREIDAVFASYLIRLIPDTKRITPYYLFYTLSGNEYQGYISGASTGSTRMTANARLLVDFNLILPSVNLLHMFEDSVTPLRRQITNLLIQNEKLATARDILLPRMMSGEIDV